MGPQASQVVPGIPTAQGDLRHRTCAKFDLGTEPRFRPLAEVVVLRSCSRRGMYLKQECLGALRTGSGVGKTPWRLAASVQGLGTEGAQVSKEGG